METKPEATQFPILEEYTYRGEQQYVPWSFVAQYEEQAYLNHFQTLQRLAERGGLSWSELYSIMRGERWPDKPIHNAKEKVLQAVEEQSSMR